MVKVCKVVQGGVANVGSLPSKFMSCSYKIRGIPTYQSRKIDMTIHIYNDIYTYIIIFMRKYLSEMKINSISSFNVATLVQKKTEFIYLPILL